MGLALAIIGVLLAAVGIQGTQAQLASLVVSDFSGAGNFWDWIAALFFFGALGYYSPLQTSSRLLIVLILLVFILSNEGIWQKLQTSLASPVVPSAPPANPVPAPASVATGIQTSSTATTPSVSASPSGVAATIPGVGSVNFDPFNAGSIPFNSDLSI